MFYICVDKLHKVIAWSNKCGGSSIRRQIIMDLDDPKLIEQLKQPGVTGFDIISQNFQTNPNHTLLPKDYEYLWYVRDPFYRVLSCFINRKILIDKDDPELTFKDFVFNLDYFRSKSSNIKSHTEPQTKNYFEAPWNIIDINDAVFSFKQKMNSTKYDLGDKLHAWDIPSKDLVVDNKTYSPISFYSQEISDAVKNFYVEDYAFLKDKINLI